MNILRSANLGFSVVAMTLVAAIIATLLGTSTIFYHSEWLALTGVALFVLAGMPALRALTGPSPSENLLTERRNSGRKVSHSLIAVSSAAILAVYAAGYDKTSSAADRLEAESSAPRRHAVAVAEVPEIARPAGAVSPVEPPSAAVNAVATPPAPAAERPIVDRPVAVATQAATAVAVVETPSSDSAPAPTAKSPDPVAIIANAVLIARQAESAPIPTPVPAAVAALASQSQYRDGSYLGWGSCRHGQIQVEVVIQAGKIASAEIAQCRTRYSCSVIRTTPPEMVAKQTPETLSNVTGATQSVDAYYFAVKEALKEAAKPAQ